MNKLLALLIKVPSSLALGCVVALGLMQNDPWLKDRIERMMIQSVTELVGEPYHVTVSAIDLLRGKVILKNASLSSSMGDWSFQCPEIHIDASWFSWVKGKGFDTAITMYNPTIFTQYEKGFTIEQPFYTLVNAPVVLPFNLVRCSAENAAITMVSQTGEVSVHCGGTTLLDSQMALTKIICSDGQMLNHSAHPRHALFAHQLSGAVTIEVPQSEEPYSLVVNLSCVRPIGVEVPYQLYYTYRDTKGYFKWRAEDGSCTVEADDIEYGDDTSGIVTVSGALGELASLVTDDERVRTTKGTGSFEGLVTFTDTGYTYEGASQVKDASYNGVTVSHADLSLVGDEKGLKATIDKAETAGLLLKGRLATEFAQGMSGVFSLLEPYDGLPQCVVKKGRAKLAYDGNQLTADVKARGTFLDCPQVPIRARLDTDFATAQLKGTFAGNPITIAGDVAPLKLRGLSLQDPLHRTRLDLQDQEGSLQGTIDSTLLKKVLQAITGYQLHGDAHVQVKTYETEEGTRVVLEVNDASLKIPGTYTVIKELSGMIDVSSTDSCVIIRDLHIVFHKGSAWSSCASIYFNDDGSLKGAHIPLQCKGLLISKEKELFGTLSGGITLTYTDRWVSKGLLTIENAHLRSNLLSSKVQRDLVHASSVGAPLVQNIDLDVHLQSRTPIKVQTPFFQADAHLDVSLKGSAAQPSVEGSIELAHGVFAFPYKPLFVTNGTLTLSPRHPDGPMIDLTAKNKIRTYNVTMRVTGSLHQPNVSFESSPQLSEEGIITLLLVGADHGSLAAAMPRVLMEQIEDILFGSESSLTRIQQILKGLLAPLKNVRLVQKDTTPDELQAVLEVDINDRLRAKAQNNLQLTDETQLELEYVVSDDITVKAVRDQAGSLGGEVEMRWKF